VCVLFTRYTCEIAYIYLHNWTAYKLKTPWLISNALVDLFFILTLLVYTQSLEESLDELDDQLTEKSPLTKAYNKCTHCGHILFEGDTPTQIILPDKVNRHYPPHPPYEPYYGNPSTVADRMRKSATPMSIAMRVKRERSEVVDEVDEFLSIDLPPNVPLAHSEEDK